jgi:hypothetical protein
MGFVISMALATVLELTPLLELIVICTLAIHLLRIKLVMFDESENSPWYVRATCSFMGIPIVSRTHRRGDIQVVEKYEDSGMTPSGTAYGEKYWKEVEVSNGQSFFSGFEIFFFGHKRLSRELENFL